MRQVVSLVLVAATAVSVVDMVDLSVEDHGVLDHLALREHGLMVPGRAGSEVALALPLTGLVGLLVLGRPAHHGLPGLDVRRPLLPHLSTRLPHPFRDQKSPRPQHHSATRSLKLQAPAPPALLLLPVLARLPLVVPPRLPLSVLLLCCRLHNVVTILALLCINPKWHQAA